MTSACIFKDALKNHTQIFLKFGESIFEICLHLINLNATLESLLSLMRRSGAGTSKEIPLQESALTLPAILITLPFSFFNISYLLHQFITLISKMTSNIPRLLMTLMCSMWNKAQVNLVHKDTIPPIFSTQPRYPNNTGHGCPQYRQ